jgi:general secretion pathway protein E
MGVQPFLVASSLVAAIAQRLVRVVCKECRVPHRISRDELVNAQIRDAMVEEFLAQGTFFQASLEGCAKCNFTGYKGRRGIYEIMIVDDVVRPMILRNADSNAIKKAAVAEQGMMLLREDGVRKAAMGLTTLEEVMRVTEEDVL